MSADIVIVKSVPLRIETVGGKEGAKETENTSGKIEKKSLQKIRYGCRKIKSIEESTSKRDLMKTPLLDYTEPLDLAFLVL